MVDVAAGASARGERNSAASARPRTVGCMKWNVTPVVEVLRLAAQRGEVAVGVEHVADEQLGAQQRVHEREDGPVERLVVGPLPRRQVDRERIGLPRREHVAVVEARGHREGRDAGAAPDEERPQQDVGTAHVREEPGVDVHEREAVDAEHRRGHDAAAGEQDRRRRDRREHGAEPGRPVGLGRHPGDGVGVVAVVEAVVHRRGSARPASGTSGARSRRDRGDELRPLLAHAVRMEVVAAVLGARAELEREAADARRAAEPLGHRVAHHHRRCARAAARPAPCARGTRAPAGPPTRAR